MKKHQILGSLLITTILINCGNNNTADQIGETKAKKGIAAESQPGDPVSITGSPLTTVVTAQDRLLPSDLDPSLRKFLSSNNLQSTYLAHLENKSRLEAQLREFSPELNNAIWVKQYIQPLYTAASKSSLQLVNKLYETRLDEFQKFDFKGDLTASEGWADVKALGRNLNYFDPNMIEFTARRDYFRMYEPDLDEVRLQAGLKVNPADGVKGLRADTEQYPIYLEVKERYKEAINQPLTDEALHLLPTGVSTQREKLQHLDQILYWGGHAKVSKILLTSESDTEMQLSVRGATILDDLTRRFLREPYGVVTPTALWTNLGNFPLGPQDTAVVNVWREYLSAICYAGARNSTFINLFSDRIITNRLFSMQADRVEAINQSLSLPRLGLPEGLFVYVSMDDEGYKLVNRADPAQYMVIDPKLATALESEFQVATITHLKTLPEFAELFDWYTSTVALSSGSIKDLSGAVSFRDARMSLTGRVEGRSLSVNGVSGQAIELGMPLFVNVKGNVDGAKATEAATGSVAYRLGNTVIGAIQGYANSGAGFELDGHQLESSVVASHSFGGLFIEGQAGSVAAASVHGSDWNGVRSQFTVGFDTSIVSPFVQVAYRQLDRDGLVGEKDTAAYVGVDMEVANLTADTYSLNTRLLTKVGYGEKSLSAGTKDLGSSVEVRGSVEWTAGVNLNSGVSFSTNLGLDTLSGSSAGVKVGLDR